MKTLYISRTACFSLLALFVSCGPKQETQETASDTTILMQPETKPQMTEAEYNASVLGSYVGEFRAKNINDKAVSPSYTNRINLSVDSLVGDSLYGHSIVAGTNTRFIGNYKASSGVYQVKAREIGGGKYDGLFSFKLDSSAKTAKGEWLAFDSTLDVPHREFELEKRLFAYDPNLEIPAEFANAPLSEDMEEMGEIEALTEDVLKFNASKTLLKKEDIENMKRGDLEVIRNAIYARHGYSFRNRKMRYLFDGIEWYVPVSTDIRSKLTELEQKNIALLKRYEEHAQKYYDYFGR